ncbi:MAG TPA: VCBS repeat-containing protein, partial [Candidatus Acidoferrum sp.]|nr:VCBS repeat-containing protein [Candidatus Acidoferrum sp.]
GPTIAGCPLLPADNIWNVRVDTLPIHLHSGDYVAAIGSTKTVHPDFGSGTWNGGPIGIPFTTVPGTQPRVPIRFDYADESDPGPYPIPANAPIEGGPSSTGDRHVLVVDVGTCTLYEVYDAHLQADGSWSAGSGAVFNLSSNALRPAGWTSADAAGLPILPGLVRYDEVVTGEIRHALRFTAPVTQRLYVWPARHYASSNTSPHVPPMGQRFRLRASFDVSPFTPTVQVVLRALQRYGMMLADNGSSWYLSGVPDPHWNDDELVGQLRLVKGSDFEAVDVSALMVGANSGQVRSGITPPPPKTHAPWGDIDGDGKRDLVVYRPTTGEWFIFGSASGFQTRLFGAPAASGLGDMPLLGDFDGDGKTDLAIFRQATGEWLVFGSASGFQTRLFGAPAASGAGDTPVPADYDGDGKADLAIYRKATGEWFIFGSASGFQTRLFGAPAASGLGDTPMPADYDGDGKADLAIYRKATGEWLIFGSASGFQTRLFGAPAASGLGDIPVPGDFDGDGKADIAVRRGATAEWLVLQSSTGQIQTTTFGMTNDLPLPQSAP